MNERNTFNANTRLTNVHLKRDRRGKSTSHATSLDSSMSILYSVLVHLHLKKRRVFAGSAVNQSCG